MVSGAGGISTLFEYGYAYDGGRRWRKDYIGNTWTWYPCGVVCSAGDLVELQSDLTGAVWVTSALYLRGLNVIRRNSEYHHFEPNDACGIVTNATGAITSNNVYDHYGVARFTTGTAASLWRWQQTGDESTSIINGMMIALTDRGRFIVQRRSPLVSVCSASPAGAEINLFSPVKAPKFVCKIPKPKLVGHTHWCCACGAKCTDSCDLDDVDCVIACGNRQKKCLQRVGFVF